MNTGLWQKLKRLPAVIVAPRPEPAEYSQRIVKLQRNIILPARLVVVATVLYHFYTSPWLGNTVNAYGVIFETIEKTFVACALFVCGFAAVLYVVRRFPPASVQWLVFAVGLSDAVFLAGLTVLTNGFESILYWVYPVLILLNAISIPLATPQIVLNLLLAIFFLAAGLLESHAQPELAIPSFRLPASRQRVDDIPDLRQMIISLQELPQPVRRRLWDVLPDELRSRASNYLATGQSEQALKQELAMEFERVFNRPRYYNEPPVGTEVPESSPDPFILRVTVLVLLTFCCYGLQVLAAAQQRTEEEQKEFQFRTEQLRSAGRLAAEVAHQIKNPLAIINNVTFSLTKKFAREKPEAAQQIAIIREEVAKADRIITQVMGYAQLSEGRVQKLEVVDELNRAIDEVFPPVVPTGVQVRRDFVGDFPPLLMQQKHFFDAVSNLLQNARDAAAGRGSVLVQARTRPDNSVEVVVQDSGPGVARDKVEQIFEAYFTTKENGSGLGLAVVRHNVELYGGRVTVDSELGKGAKFTLVFPARTVMLPTA